MSSKIPDSSSTAHYRGKQVAPLHGELQRLAGGHLFSHLHHRPGGIDEVSGRPGDRFQGLYQRHAGSEGGRQGAGEAGDGGLVQDGSDAGDLKANAVENIPESG